MRRTVPVVLALIGAVAVGTLGVASTATGAPIDPAADGVSAPYLIPASRVAPDYPPAAYRAKYGGEVAVRVTVLPDGSVTDAEVVDSTRKNVGFEKSALRAVTKWRFEPALRGEDAIASYAEVRIGFRPPLANQGGGVSIDFGSRRGMGGGPTGPSARETATTPQTPDPNARQPNKDRINTYGKPGCGSIGCVYDRRGLIPADPPGHTEHDISFFDSGN